MKNDEVSYTTNKKCVNTSHSKIVNEYKRYKENKRYIKLNSINKNN